MAGAFASSCESAGPEASTAAMAVPDALHGCMWLAEPFSFPPHPPREQAVPSWEKLLKVWLVSRVQL